MKYDLVQTFEEIRISMHGECMRRGGDAREFFRYGRCHLALLYCTVEKHITRF